MDTPKLPQSQILLVEDDVKIAELVIRSLEKSGYQVQHVTDGVSGLRHIFKSTTTWCCWT